MTDYQALFDEAEQLFEEGRCAQARDLYRQVLMQNPEHRMAAANLGGAERYEPWTFRVHLRKLYPDSLGARLMEIDSLPGNGHKLNQYIAEALASTELTFRERFNLYFRRFKNACERSDNKLVVEDFRTIWELAETYFAPALKRSLLRDVTMNIQNSKAIPGLETLAQDEQFPDTIRAFLRAKIAELETLDAALAEIPRKAAP